MLLILTEFLSLNFELFYHNKWDIVMQKQIQLLLMIVLLK